MNIKQNKYLEGLNDRQKEAVKITEGPLLIMAGAGSGKTRVITHRIAYLIDEKDVSPMSILAITFTNKAATEMKTRLSSLIGSKAEMMWVSTFHSMCTQILRRDAERIGLSRTFSILDGGDTLMLVRKIIDEFNLDSKKYDAKGIISIISDAKNGFISADEYRARAKAGIEEGIAKIYTEYEKRLSKNSALDFDDLIIKTIELFQKNPDVLEKYQERLQYIHIDEYQDTNHAQYLLVNLLAQKHQNLCIVGDADQSIYGWRGADISNILNFEKDYPSAQTVLLEENYRSTAHILNAANSVIRNNVIRKDKKLWTSNPDGEKVNLFTAGNEKLEAQFLIKKINKLVKKENIKMSDVAVLYRTNALSRTIEDALIKEGIPYQIHGGLKFFDRMEIKDIMAYVKLIANPDDNLSFERIINKPKRYLGRVALDKIQEFATDNDISKFKALEYADSLGLTKSATASCKDFYKVISELTAKAKAIQVEELMEEIYVKSRYREMLEIENTIESESRLENLGELLSVASEFDKAYVGDPEEVLIEFLTSIALISDVKEDPSETKEKVSLMTVHAAKGLEFPVVFVIGMEDGLFPNSRALYNITQPELLEEERRLAYVAITRAEKHLFITNAKTRLHFGKMVYNCPSLFIGEVPGLLTNDLNRKPVVKSSLENKVVSTTTATSDQNDEWNVGEFVTHKKFGEGFITSVTSTSDGYILEVKFSSDIGSKKLLSAFVKLQKV